MENLLEIKKINNGIEIIPSEEAIYLLKTSSSPVEITFDFLLSETPGKWKRVSPELSEIIDNNMVMLREINNPNTYYCGILLNIKKCMNILKQGNSIFLKKYETNNI